MSNFKIALIMFVLSIPSISNAGSYQHEIGIIKKVQLNGEFDPSWKNVKPFKGKAVKMFSNDFSGFNGVICIKNNQKTLKDFYPELYSKTRKHRNQALTMFPFFCSIPFYEIKVVADQSYKEKKSPAISREKEKIPLWENWNQDLKSFNEFGGSIEDYQQDNWGNK